MAIGTQSTLIGGASKSLLVALDQSGNLAAAHVNVNSSGVEVGTSASPLAVSIGNFPSSQPVTLASVPALASGANTIGAVTQASGPWTVSWSGQSIASVQSGAWTVALATGSSVTLGAGSAVIGSVSVAGPVAVTGPFYQVTQPVSVATLPLPVGAAVAANQPVLNADGGSLAHITNFPPTQNVSAIALPLPSGAAQDGADVTGVNQLAGGAGIRGWLSGIYAKLSGTLSVGINTALPTGANVIGAVIGSGAFTTVGQGLTGAVPVGAPVSVSGIDASGLKQHLRVDTFGAPTDSAWSSGGGSLIALSKAMVAAQQATTAAVTGSSLVPPSPTFTQTSALASNLVLKAAAGSLYACYVTTSSTPGWMMLFDATGAPANGTVMPKNCIYCPANATTEIELPFLTAEPFATGITAVFSSTGPFTLTASSSVFMKGIVQ